MNSTGKKPNSTRPDVAAKGSPSPTPSPTQPPNPKSKSPSPSSRKRLPPWVMITLRILRTLLVPFLCVAALIAGVVIGYVYIGGREIDDVWSLETWKHLFELVFAN